MDGLSKTAPAQHSGRNNASNRNNLGISLIQKPAATNWSMIRNCGNDFRFWRRAMRFILGMFCGAVLMLGSAYIHDAGMVRVGPSQPFVNWDALIGMLR
jgi:hypothetical protein